jgi:hypothetical protein
MAETSNSRTLTPGTPLSSELLDYRANDALLLVQPNAQAERQFLFLNFDPQHVRSLCAWLVPTLRAAGDRGARGQLEFCERI